MLQELLDKRMTLITACRKIKDAVDSEDHPSGKGQWTGEERQEWERYKNDITELNKKIDNLKNDDNAAKWLADQEAQNTLPATRRRTDPASHNGGNPGDRGTERRVVMWDSRNPYSEMTSQAGGRNRHTTRRVTMSGHRASSAYDHGFNRYLGGVSPEKAFDGFNSAVYIANDPEMQDGTIQSGDEQRAGYFIASEEFMAGLLRNVDDEVFIQQNARVITVKQARSLGIRKRVAKASAFNWGSELGDVTQNLERSLKFGNRVLTPHYLTGAVRISRDLLRFATEDVQALVMYELGINLREILEQAFLLANGVQRPLGLLVPSVDGISTARDINSATTSKFTFDDWQKAKYTLKAQYRNKAKWMVHRNTLSALAIERAQNSDGSAGAFTYLWEPSRQVGEPDRILGLPYIESEWMPSATGAGNYYAMLADYSYYWIAYAMELEVRRLDEIASRTNEIEYHMRLKVDAMPILEEAFVRLAYAAS